MSATLEPSNFEPAKRFVDELTEALVEAHGMPFDQAVTYVRPIVAYLQKQYGGDEIYIPRPGRTYTVADIVEATRNGMGVKRICAQFGISRRTYFWLMAQHR